MDKKGMKHEIGGDLFFMQCPSNDIMHIFSFFILIFFMISMR